MEASRLISFKGGGVSNASEQLVLLIEREKKILRESKREKERRKGGVRKWELEQGVTQAVTWCHS